LRQFDFLQLHPLLCRAEAGVLLDSSCKRKQLLQVNLQSNLLIK
jgi:hypothetical protein